MKDIKYAPAVDRALQILQFYTTTTHPYVGITEIANALSLNKSTVHTILNTMMKYDFITKSRISGNYALGPAVKKVAAAYGSHDRITNCFKDIVNRYHGECPEAFCCSVMEQEVVRVLALLQARSAALTVYTPPGTVLSPIMTSAGKILMARFDDNSVDRMYDYYVEQETCTRVPPKEKYVKQIRSVRRLGYCFDEREFGESICGIAGPLTDKFGRCIAAISISLPKERLTEELKSKYINIVLKISKEFTVHF